MSAAQPVPPVQSDPAGPEERAEQRLVLYGVSWKDYRIVREALDRPGLRMTYLQGALELMSPSRQHELEKSMIGRLIELFALERDVRLYAYGSMTFRREAEEAGAEPDECYTVGEQMPGDDVPDIVVEVVVSRGGLDKLAVYERLRAREVWFFEKGTFHLHELTEHGYRLVDRSRFLAELDLALLARYVVREDQPDAVREYRDRIRG